MSEDTVEKVLDVAAGVALTSVGLSIGNYLYTAGSTVEQEYNTREGERKLLRCLKYVYWSAGLSAAVSTVLIAYKMRRSA